MAASELHVVTGAFGHSGRHIARRLLERGAKVRTLTNSPTRDREFGARVEVAPLAFDDPPRLVDALRGAHVLYNTYWVRFDHARFTFADAVRNTLTLFDAARAAGVRRIVHVSITNPSESSPFAYFRGKARLERALRESGLSHAILRPAVLFSETDILVNNIAWMLRRLPIFTVFGDGAYRIQPLHVDDFAQLAIAAGAHDRTVTHDAVGPEKFTFRELVAAIGDAIGVPARIVCVPASAGYALTRIAGWLLRDVVLTWEEIGALTADLLHSDSPPEGSTHLTEWATQRRATLGVRYASELARRIDRTTPYDDL